MKREVARQLVHILGGFFFIEALLYLGAAIAMVLSVIVLFGAIVYSLLLASGVRVPGADHVAYMTRHAERHVPARAGIIYLLGVSLSFIVFYHQPFPVLFAALVLLSIGDGFSSIFGKAFGRTVLLGNRTLEGSMAGLVFAFIFLLLVFNPYKALLVATVGMAAEYLPLEDNITVPLAAGFAALLL